MPNYCDTQIVIYSQNKSVIHELHAQIKSFISTPSRKSLSDNTHWLGSLLCRSGFNYNDVCNGKYGYTRSWISYLDEVEDNVSTGYSSFFLEQSDAWSPATEPWYHIIRKLYPRQNIKLAWLCEEPGCNIFQKSDPDGLFFTDAEYNVDCYVENPDAFNEFPELVDEHRSFSSIELQKIFKLQSIDSILARAEIITEEMQEKYGGGFYLINKYEELDN